VDPVYVQSWPNCWISNLFLNFWPWLYGRVLTLRAFSPLGHNGRSPFMSHAHKSRLPHWRWKDCWLNWSAMQACSAWWVINLLCVWQNAFSSRTSHTDLGFCVHAMMQSPYWRQITSLIHMISMTKMHLRRNPFNSRTPSVKYP